VREEIIRESFDPRTVVAAIRERQSAVVPLRQIVTDVPDLGVDHVKIVEQPLRAGRNRLAAMHLVRGREVRGAKTLRVLVQAAEMGASADDPTPPLREARGSKLDRERMGPLFELLEAQEFRGSPGRRTGIDGPSKRKRNTRDRLLGCTRVGGPRRAGPLR
jgi:hypothetical protein